MGKGERAEVAIVCSGESGLLVLSSFRLKLRVPVSQQRTVPLCLALTFQIGGGATVSQRVEMLFTGRSFACLPVAASPRYLPVSWH